MSTAATPLDKDIATRLVLALRTGRHAAVDATLKIDPAALNRQIQIAGGKHAEPPFQIALRFGHAGLAAWLLDKGADVSPAACPQALLHAASIGAERLVLHLISLKHNPHQADPNHPTPVVAALLAGHHRLLSAMANSGVKLSDSGLLLHILAERHLDPNTAQTLQPMFEVLLASGLDPAAIDEQGQSALAVPMPDEVRLVLVRSIQNVQAASDERALRQTHLAQAAQTSTPRI